MTSKWGSVPLADSFARWPTPNRCCSSVITSPRLAKTVASVISAWVPTTRSTFPSAICSRSSFLSLGFMEPVSNPTRMPIGSKSRLREW